MDGLGPPWPVHGCWEQHYLEKRYKVQWFEDDLYKTGYNGRFIETDGLNVELPLDRSSLLVTVHGFVSDNHAL